MLKRCSGALVIKRSINMNNETVSNRSVNQTLLNESKTPIYPNLQKKWNHLDIDETIESSIRKFQFINVRQKSQPKYVQTIQI
jgi:hypothetical protein